MSLPSLLDDLPNNRKLFTGEHIIDQSLKNYFNAFPTESKIRRVLSHAFVINQPMSGVGGDGFWINAISEDVVYLVVFDCMGHGRMASIMTRVYLEVIKSIIDVDKIEDPGQFLDAIHLKIKGKFEGKNNLKIGSGADLAMIKYSIPDRKIWYAGAKMDLFYVENEELKAIKSSRRQTGDHFDVERKYETHALRFKSAAPIGIYLFTDGLTDLIGGKKQKKLGKKNAQILIRNAQKQSIKRARAYVERSINSWSLGQDRLDDVLMLHFRI